MFTILYDFSQTYQFLTISIGNAPRRQPSTFRKTKFEPLYCHLLLNY